MLLSKEPKHNAYNIQRSTRESEANTATGTCPIPPLSPHFSGQTHLQTLISPCPGTSKALWIDRAECTHYRRLGLNTSKQKKKNTARESEAKWRDVYVSVCAVLVVRGLNKVSSLSLMDAIWQPERERLRNSIGSIWTLEEQQTHHCFVNYVIFIQVSCCLMTE